MKKRKIKILNTFFLVISISLFIYSAYNIYRWYHENQKSKSLLEEIQNHVEIEENDDNTNTKIIEQEDNIIPEDNPYWNYIKMKLINVDFTKLKKINNETVGWLEVKGTNINYPFVQGIDNSYYLKHSFDKSYNTGGWVFLDYRNSTSELNKNTIIYAHNRKDKSMFGSLKNILNNSWFNNLDNHIIKVSTENNNTLWQIFSIYHIPTTNDYMYIDFINDNQFIDFTNLIIQRSIYNFNVNISENDKILTLSTCYNSKEKLVVHAKLIKIEEKKQ